MGGGWVEASDLRTAKESELGMDMDRQTGWKAFSFLFREGFNQKAIGNILGSGQVDPSNTDVRIFGQ